MESVYYVTHPRIDKTGVVYAPTTEKARTTFLDWLERNGFIGRAHRHLLRRDMIAERIEDPNVPADVVLHYGYEEPPVSRYGFEVPEVHDIPVRFEEPEVEDIPVRLEEPEPSFEDYAAMEKGGHPFEPEKSKMMPVQEVMLRGYVK